MPKPSLLNLTFLVHAIIVILVIAGIFPRTIVLPWTLILIGYVIFASLEDSTIFFVRSIPLFIAIPLTGSYDAFNMWRILSVIIFSKWIFTSIFNRGLDWSFRLFQSRLFLPTAILFIFAVLSLFQAPNVILGIKRIIYFINLSLIGVVIAHLAVSRSFIERLIKNIAIPVVIVVAAGIIQLIMAFSMDIFRFVDIWVNTIERNLFGTAWANIALKANTWFAYYGDQLSLRMFSIFPDSHSFPIFLLLGLPAIFAISIKRLVNHTQSFRNLFFTRGNLWLALIPLIYLELLLSGTRGIWAASVGAVVLALIVIFLLKKQGIEKSRRRLFIYITSYITIFFLLFPVAYMTFISDQFQEHKTDTALFKKRVKSIIDIAETSNKERIRIWKLSLQSIVKHPFIGQGIGNFPVVLNQDLALAKAGSSAHNLYLHIAAEMGIIALMAALYFIWLIMSAAYRKYKSTDSPVLLIYYGAFLLYFSWVLFYSLTDVALFDERAFLLFVTASALAYAKHE